MFHSYDSYPNAGIWFDRDSSREDGVLLSFDAIGGQLEASVLPTPLQSYQTTPSPFGVCGLLQEIVILSAAKDLRSFLLLISCCHPSPGGSASPFHLPAATDSRAIRPFGPTTNGSESAFQLPSSTACHVLPSSRLISEPLVPAAIHTLRSSLQATELRYP